MIFIGVGAVNGLGNTKGCANAPEKIAAFLDVKNFSSLKLNKDNVEEQEKQIYESAKELIKNSKPIFLGGDHSLSYSTCKAFFQLYPQAKLIVFDAHPDCMPPMKEPTHEEWLRALIEREHIPSPKNNILLIGVRKIEAEESKFMIEND
ncbi:arginase family protein, partial [Candidatus Pacearchaeota archaeon]